MRNYSITFLRQPNLYFDFQQNIKIQLLILSVVRFVFDPDSIFLVFTSARLLSHMGKSSQMFSFFFFACFSLSPCLQGSHFQSSFIRSSLSNFASVLSPIINVNLIFSTPQQGDSLSSSLWNP